MTANNEEHLIKMMTNAIKGINELRDSNDELKTGQIRIENRLENVENRLENVENQLEKVETEVKVVSKKISHSIDGVAELRARIEILEEKILSVN